MTQGEVRSETSVAVTLGGAVRFIRPLVIDYTKAYPTLLQADLQGRYTGQAGAISVYNAGLGGETVVAGAMRLPSVVDGGLYQVLLLMEGVNDFPDYQSALNAMKSMVEHAKGRNMKVYLATEPPENPNPVGCGGSESVLSQNWQYVSPYNSGLSDLANAEGIPLVDVHAAFNGDVTTLVDCDGLHPTPAGYQVIANTFFKSIESTLEVTSTPTPTTLRKIAPVRRSR
jgi:lysophospholipase L1-like esterase